jgi:hypothetical protein
MTVIYEITAHVRGDLCEAYERYMRGQHIPDLLATGYFVSASFTRSVEGRYRISYALRAQETLNEYLAREAPRLRGDFESHFPEGVELTREVWSVIKEFPDSD